MYLANDTLRMVLADESAIVRAGIKRMFAGVPEIEIIEEISDARSAIASIRDLEPDLVMLGFQLGSGCAVDVLRDCRDMSPRPICIVHTLNAEPSIRSICYAAGADIFYDKGRDMAPLLSMLRKLAKALLRNELAVS